MYKIVEHSKNGKYIYVEIRVRINDYRHVITEEHVFHDTKSYRKFIHENISFGEFRESSWITSGDSIIVREDYEKDLS